MYTQTTKDILEPVADAIASLLIMNFEADEKNLALPDLTEMAVVIDGQAKNLVDIGKSLLESGDDQLRRDMSPTCDTGT